jgi:hypothetical protein
MTMTGTWALTLHILSYKHFGILMLLGLRQDRSLVIEWTATIRLHLISPCFVSMQVYSIREAAANNLKRLAEEFGPEWALQHIIPQVSGCVCFVMILLWSFTLHLFFLHQELAHLSADINPLWTKPSCRGKIISWANDVRSLFLLDIIHLKERTVGGVVVTIHAD